jgi:hypothetical protein
MSSTTFLTTTSAARHARSSSTALSRLRQLVQDRRHAAQSRRDLESVLAGHHGRPMRDEMLAVMSRSG